MPFEQTQMVESRQDECLASQRWSDHAMPVFTYSRLQEHLRCLVHRLSPSMRPAELQGQPRTFKPDLPVRVAK
jgi:hypothetical protein